jgi:carotenoid cleavage dioxygenase
LKFIGFKRWFILFLDNNSRIFLIKMKDLADQKAIHNYPKMTVLKSLKNVLKQKLIRIIGLFLRRHAFRNEKDIYQKIVYRPVNETEISNFK